MKTALLFPGLDALFVASKMKRWMEVPMVRNSLSETGSLLSKFTGETEDLEKLVTESSRPHLNDFDRTSIALAGIQVGIARTLEKSEKWDLVVGCSHGDIARSVITGVMNLEDAVEIIWTFAELRKLCPLGKTANVRTIDGSALSSDQIGWLREEGFYPSLWSTHHATVAAELSLIDRGVAECRERGLKMKPIFPFAIHSPTMSSLAARFGALAPKWSLKTPKWPIFSSVYVRFLLGVEEIQAEAIAGAVTPIAWTKTLESLSSEHGVTRYLNVGPSNALTGWGLNQTVVQDAWELLS